MQARHGSGNVEEPTVQSTAVVPRIKDPASPRDLSLLVLRRIQNDDPPVTCAICLDDIKVGEVLAGSPNEACIHEFHLNCISQALMRKSTCPYCARDFFLSDHLVSKAAPRVQARDAMSHLVSEDLEDQGATAVSEDNIEPPSVQEGNAMIACWR